MGSSSIVRRIYDVDVLDTRFTTSSSTPYKAVLEARDDPRKQPFNKPDPKAKPKQWHTLEYRFYLTIALSSLPYMFWVNWSVSRPSDHQYPKYEQLLSPGWIAGRKMDNTDSQYSTFRENLPYMSLLLLVHPLLRRAYNALNPLPQSPGAKSTTATPEQANARLIQRASFDFGFAIIYLAALHGFSALKVLTILWINFNIATRLPRQHVPVVTWVFNVGILFANELCSGYHFKAVAELLVGAADPKNVSAAEPLLVTWGAWLDSWGGLMSRWEILFNITILRLISFNMDYYWSLDRRASSPIEKQLDPTSLSERDRVAIPAQAADYSFRNYLAYAIYAPLYLTGPILTFNDYISQLRYKPLTIETSRTTLYAIRLVLCFLAMEIILHFSYVGAIAKASPEWGLYTAPQISMLAFFNLHIIWLKLLLPWRLFRLWSLMDGIDPPENMLRCVSNNFSMLSFWRAWHRSYNRWLVRYLFVPLGGGGFATWRAAARSTATYLLVFTFVALWHDIQLRLLIWGWLVVLFILPEVAAGYLFPARRFEGREHTYRILRGIGAVGNVLALMIANLVGFAVGLDGLEMIVRGILDEWGGLVFLVCACGVLFTGVQVMFEIREAELRRGISLRC